MSAKLEKQLRAALEQNHRETKREIQVEICVASPHGPATNEVEQMRDCYAIMKQTFTDLYSSLQAVRQRHRTSCTNEEYTDLAGIMREIANQCEELRKEFSKEVEQITHVVVSRWEAKASEPGQQANKFEGRYFRSYPDTEVRIFLPRFDKDPVKYKQWVDWLGFPEWMQDRGKELYQEREFETQIFSLNMNGIMSLFERMRYNNEMPPPFIIEGLEKITAPVLLVKRIAGRDIL